jgi:hypothetical protein
MAAPVPNAHELRRLEALARQGGRVMREITQLRALNPPQDRDEALAELQDGAQRLLWAFERDYRQARLAVARSLKP